MVKTNLTTYKGLLNTILLKNISNFIHSKKNVYSFYFESDITYCNASKKDIKRDFYITIKVNNLDYILRGCIYDMGDIEYIHLIPQDNSGCVWWQELNDKNFKFKDKFE